MLGFGKTDLGQKRENNEDTIFVSNQSIGCLENLYIVADGMGGHKAGQIASKEAVEIVVEYMKNNCVENEPLDNLISAINVANEKVFELGRSNQEYESMGTTIVAATLNGSNLFVGNVGDSRLYKISDGQISQITEDHSLVATMIKAGEITKDQAKNHPQRNVITRAVGTDKEVVADGFIIKVKSGDTIVMCSDGLSNMLGDGEIYSISSNKELTLEKRAEMLIDSANENGGSDNISVVIIDV